MRKTFWRVVQLAAGAALFSSTIAAPAAAQTAEITGRVLDASKAVVPGVIVTAVNENTGLTREARTDGSGTYVLTFVPPGPYQVIAKMSGFQTVTRTGVVLVVGDRVQVDFMLQPSAVAETVTVTIEPSHVSTSPAVGTVIDRQFVENIPLNGRTFQSLIALTPGVVLTPSGLTNTGGQFSVNGQRAGSNSFMVDGVSANFSAAPGNFGAQDSSGNLPGLSTFGTTQSLVSVEALQEFRVQTSSYSAQYGRQPGGQISIVTRSGTNQIHGSLYDYVRNDKLDANDWFANRAQQGKAPQRQNNFGGTLGGPFRIPGVYNGRGRTFVFASYEGLRLRQPQFNLTNVPTAAMRQAAPAAVQPILNTFPLPNGRDLGNGLAEFSGSYSDPSELDATSVRVDHNISRRLSMFARYNHAPSETKIRRASISLASMSATRLVTQTLTAGFTAVLPSGASNQFTVNWSDNEGTAAIVQDSFGGATPAPRNVLIPPQYDSGPSRGSLTLLFPIRTSTSAPNLTYFNDFLSSQRQINIVDTFTFRVKSHHLSVGFDYRRLAPTIASNSYFLNGTFVSQAEVLSGIANGASVAQSLPTKPLFTNFSAYAQDTMKVAPRLTIDAGVRWDVNPAPDEANGHRPLAVDQIDNYATMRMVGSGTPLWKTRYSNLAPRLGAAYQLSETPGRDSVVRGAFGVFYDTGNDLVQRTFIFFPYLVSRNVSAVRIPIDPVQMAPPPLPNLENPAPPFGTFAIFDPNLRSPYTLQWNVAFEQALGRNQTVTVSYVGASGRRLLQSNQANISAFNPSFTVIQPVANGADSNYRALQTQFQRRLSRGLQVIASYTWSRAIDSDSTSNSLRRAQKGYAAFDVRHLGTAAATYDIPVPRSNAIVRALLAHWSVDAKFSAQSALPLDLVASAVADPLTGELVNIRPNVVPGEPFYIDDSTVPGGRRINRAAFSIPAAGTSGDLGRNALRGFPLWQLDFALHREFPLRKQVKMQFRAEAFNLLNHPNFGAIQTVLTANNFGQATNMTNRQLGGISQLYQIGGPRSIQLALKLRF
jgi:hypothetical protein